ncbi:hypothetical protein EES46_22065 [Streptomyces sp. ADI98-10]|nr:hypothetical protein EES46_22065 [Streptomyces sp. ADI98-10]
MPVRESSWWTWISQAVSQRMSGTTMPAVSASRPSRSQCVRSTGSWAPTGSEGNHHGRFVAAVARDAPEHLEGFRVAPAGEWDASGPAVHDRRP